MFMVVPPYLTYAEHSELLWLWNVLYPLTHVSDGIFPRAANSQPSTDTP